MSVFTPRWAGGPQHEHPTRPEKQKWVPATPPEKLPRPAVVEPGAARPRPQPQVKDNVGMGGGK